MATATAIALVLILIGCLVSAKQQAARTQRKLHALMVYMDSRGEGREAVEIVRRA